LPAAAKPAAYLVHAPQSGSVHDHTQSSASGMHAGAKRILSATAHAFLPSKDSGVCGMYSGPHAVLPGEPFLHAYAAHPHDGYDASDNASHHRGWRGWRRGSSSGPAGIYFHADHAADAGNDSNPANAGNIPDPWIIPDAWRIVPDARDASQSAADVLHHAATDSASAVHAA